jgi:hypothetical protein
LDKDKEEPPGEKILSSFLGAIFSPQLSLSSTPPLHESTIYHPQIQQCQADKSPMAAEAQAT